MSPSAAFPLACTLALLRTASGGALQEAGKEYIDLDLPPSQRWVGFAAKYRDDFIGRATSTGIMYEGNLGEEVSERWFKAAPVGEELMAEYKSIVDTVQDPDVTLRRLVISDMWHAVHAPSFECTGLLAAMPNGTVVHGRNIDYDMIMTMDKSKPYLLKRRGGKPGFMTIIFTRSGQPLMT
eukprot:CAMPEP_0197911202 /NCGR_PEP_ID=MMETSP1439-20131203/72388_1 /TAXON_ID=66791 /ORGANISM="Gonyaulax spinifera, Strain CCMP409" /LENGTH=180 /DNA_ID=CAMNT_0043532915 /DNA_START=64 /DNA_END=602 /DNA_ORIENTATION=-